VAVGEGQSLCFRIVDDEFRIYTVLLIQLKAIRSIKKLNGNIKSHQKWQQR
jgi:hypothetical protein